MCSKCFDGKGYPDHRERNVYKIEDEDDFDRHPKRRGKKRKYPKPKPGCKLNDGKAHVYAIVEIHGWVHERFWDHTTPWIPAVRWERRCIGCGKVSRSYGEWGGIPIGRYFNKEDIWLVEYVEKGEPFSRWW